MECAGLVYVRTYLTSQLSDLQAKNSHLENQLGHIQGRLNNLQVCVVACAGVYVCMYMHLRVWVCRCLCVHAVHPPSSPKRQGVFKPLFLVAAPALITSCIQHSAPSLIILSPFPLC